MTHNHRNLQKITLRVPRISSHFEFNAALARAEPDNIRGAIGETSYQEWLELDHLLVQLCEPLSIRPKILECDYPEGVRGCVDTLLPEVTRRWG